MGLGLTPLLGDRRGFMPPQLKNKTKKTKIFMWATLLLSTSAKSKTRLITSGVWKEGGATTVHKQHHFKIFLWSLEHYLIKHLFPRAI